jgi:protein BCP1
MQKGLKKVVGGAASYHHFPLPNNKPHLFIDTMAGPVIVKDKRKHVAAEASDEEDIVNVDFEWFDPAEIDFHGLKALLRQLFDVDNDLFDLSALADLIISQPTLGSTVKVSQDGIESDDEDADPSLPKPDVTMTDVTETKDTDPYAFLTVLNLHAHKEKPIVQSLSKYITSKCGKIPSLSTLPSLLSPSSSAQVGLILTERLINMPTEIVPPMYTMLIEEITLALKDNESYNFTHYLILSKVYTELTSTLPSVTTDSSSEPSSKKSKKKSGAAAVPGTTGETFYFHPEDEIWHNLSAGHGNYEFTKPWADGAGDAKRAFQEAGIRPLGHMVLIEKGRFEEAVKAVQAAVGGA